MKNCSTCGLDKPLEEFSKNPSKKDGLNGKCKLCHSIYRKQHYENNRQKYIDKAHVNRIKFRKWFNTEIKEKLVCSLCGEDRYWVLDFHHRNPEEKDSSVSELILSGSKSKVLKEIEKCDVLCSNCHRDLHHQEKIK